MRCGTLERAIVVLAFTGPVSVVLAGADLKPNYEKGQELHFARVMDQQMTRQMPTTNEAAAPGMKMTMKLESGSRVRVLDVKPDGATDMDWTVLYVSLSGSGPMAMDYDSRDPAKASSPVASQFGKVLNKPISVSVSGAGEVTSFKKLEEVGGMTGQVVDKLVSQQGFEDLDLFATASAPSPAEVGAEWTRTREAIMPQNMGTMVIKAHYKLAALDSAAKAAEIPLDATLSIKERGSPPADEPDDTPSMTVEKGTATGKLRWDLVAGAPASKEVETDLVMVIDSPMGKMRIIQGAQTTFRRVTLADFKLSEQKPAATQPAAGKP